MWKILKYPNFSSIKYHKKHVKSTSNGLYVEIDFNFLMHYYFSNAHIYSWRLYCIQCNDRYHQPISFFYSEDKHCLLTHHHFAMKFFMFWCDAFFNILKNFFIIFFYKIIFLKCWVFYGSKQFNVTNFNIFDSFLFLIKNYQNFEILWYKKIINYFFIS